MPDTSPDLIAHEAARLLETGSAESISAAIRQAAHSLGADDSHLPSPGRVRQHIQAMNMQALGDVGYRESVRATLTFAEELMMLLQQALPSAETLLMGRAARGLIDGSDRLYLRIYTDASVTELAEIITERGYEEPAFDTINTRFGRVNRLRIIEEGVELVLARLLPTMMEQDHRDLARDRPVETATLDELRQRIVETNDADQ